MKGRSLIQEQNKKVQLSHSFPLNVSEAFSSVFYVCSVGQRQELVDLHVPARDAWESGRTEAAAPGRLQRRRARQHLLQDQEQVVGSQCRQEIRREETRHVLWWVR